LRSHTSFLNKDNIPLSSSATTKNTIKASSLYRSSNTNGLGFNSSNLMYNKPLLSPTKENITKILNPNLKSNLNIQRNILENSNFDNVKSHLPSSTLDLGNKTSTYNPISSQNKENIEYSTIPIKTTTTTTGTHSPFDLNRLSLSNNISSSNQQPKSTTTVPLKSNYF
ncbi:hypothetical protein PIROE2DRAFT_2351, partial [Piromyces sp. E2]